MQDTTVTLLTPTAADDSGMSAISWPSIFGGALATAALTVIFVAFGGALGLAQPDSERGMMELGVTAAIWLVVTQWIASAVGGYLTGRLRVKWAGVHNHEVFFRDTAHGFLAWALAMICGAVLMGSAVMSGLDHMHNSGHRPMGGPMQAQEGPAAYYVDNLYRGADQAMTPSHPAPAMPASAGESSPAPNAPENAMAAGNDSASTGNAVMAPVAPPAPPAYINPELRAETTRILMRGMEHNGLPDSDKAYLAQQVAMHTGLSAGEANKRVEDIAGRMQADAGMAHKAVGYVSLFTALSMLIGAFIASAAAALGGSQRDEWEEAVRTGSYKG